MDILIKRNIFTDISTIGDLFVDGQWFAFTLEDKVREVPGEPVSQWKIPAVTAIPAGVYNVIITLSNKFKKLLPLVENVEGFEGIRLHSGNDADDTEGCIIVAECKDTNRVYNNTPQAAMNKLQPLIQAALDKGEKVTLTIQ